MSEPARDQPPVFIDLDRERARRGRSTERWVFRKTVAEHFGVSDRTVKRWSEDERYKRGGRNCPCRRVWGSRPQYQLGAVDAWLDEPEDPR